MQVDHSCKNRAQILHMEILQDHSSRFEPHVQVSCKTLQENSCKNVASLTGLPGIVYNV